MPSEITILKKKMILSRIDRGTIIIALAISARNEENKIECISCGVGSPIGTEIYDSVSDSYYAECASHCHVGSVPFGYYLQIDGIESWSTRIPLPEAVFKAHLENECLQKLDKWKANLPKHFKVQYIQMTSVF